jgi:exodeoxyribonuclease-3
MKNEKITAVSWNVNGMNAVMQKGFLQTAQRLDADILALQETKLQEKKLTEEMRRLPGYRSCWSFSTLKKGYSGVAVYTRLEPLSVTNGIGIPEFDAEGRILELDFGDFVFFNIYFPNGQMSEERLAYKLDFYERFFDYADRLRNEGRSLIICGDYNTAHNEIDLKNPKANQNTSGFLRIERDWLDRIVARGYVDTFRHLHPDAVEYSWWTYRFRARERNAGWRIDYFFVTEDMIRRNQIEAAFIAGDVLGSDHCPVGLVLRV